MDLAMTDSRITSRETAHSAIRRGNTWEVSWLPGKQLSRHQAISAMALAWQVADNAAVTGSGWPLIAGWAAELGMSGTQAVAMCEIAS